MVRSLLALLFSVIYISCESGRQKQEENEKGIAGNWLILYPKHELANTRQYEAYTRAVQDSIVSLLGLKLLSFHGDGSFVQLDSFWKEKGRWHFNPESKSIFIRNAGLGLDFFKGMLMDIRNDTMRIVENVDLNGEMVNLTWHLKRVDDEYQDLFRPELNAWRKQEVSDTAALRMRLQSMLKFYSGYYKLVSKESSYFLGSRVFLPFTYYQHAIGLRPFDAESNFARVFSSEQEARRAYDLLSRAVEKQKARRFPSGKDFVIEYAEYLERLASTFN